MKFKIQFMFYYSVFALVWNEIHVGDGFGKYEHCKPTTFECSKGECIAPDKVCNGIRDCADASDEIKCSSCFLESLSITNGFTYACHQKSEYRPGEFINITCQDNYASTEDGFTAVCLNGKWISSAQCLPVCKNPSPDKVKMIPSKDEYRSGDSVIAICKDGYFGSGNQPQSHLEVQCNGQDENWLKLRECHNVGTFSTSSILYFAQEQLSVRIPEYSSVDLECQVASTRADGLGEFEWMWKRDQVVVGTSRPVGGVHYSVHENGGLHIENFDTMAEGLYMCFRMDRFSILAGTLVYHAQVEPFQRLAPAVTHLPRQIVYPGDDVHLICPYSKAILSLQAQQQALWFRDGHPIWGSLSERLSYNGELHLHHVAASHRGNYTYREEGSNRECRVEVVIMEATKEKCGVETDADEGRDPWFVSLWWRNDPTPFCYGTLVAEDWILTAGSCAFGLHRRDANDIKVRIGYGKLALGWTVAMQRQIPLWHHARALVLHPMFVLSEQFRAHDIALIRLLQPLLFDMGHPSCVASPSLVRRMFQLQPCTNQVVPMSMVSGLGPLSSLYTTRRLGVITESAHIEENGKDWLSNSNQFANRTTFCVRSVARLNESAVDTGSPYLVKWKSKTYLLGVYSVKGRNVTGNVHCNHFTNVSLYYHWVAQQIGWRI